MSVVIWKAQRQVNKGKSFGKETTREKGQEMGLWAPLV